MIAIGVSEEQRAGLVRHIAIPNTSPTTASKVGLAAGELVEYDWDHDRLANRLYPDT